MAGFNPAIAGATMAATSMMIAREEEDNKKRRFRNIHGETKDQIFLKFSEPKERVLKRLNDYYGTDDENDGALIYKNNNKFNAKAFFISFAVAFFVILGIQWIIAEASWDYNTTVNFFNVIDLIGGLVVGIFFALILNRDTEIDYIKVGTRKGQTTVLIKKYDSEGYRNIDEDDLDELLETLHGK